VSRGNTTGRHKGRRSPETKRWLELEQKLDRLFAKAEPPVSVRKKRRRKTTTQIVLPPAPAKPPWLEWDEYALLLAMREKL
jgi:hypothetical protein